MATIYNKVILALGSNVDAVANMARMQEMLREIFPAIRFTPSLLTEAIGMDAPPFLNCLAVMGTADGYDMLHARLKEIETAMGSDRGARRAGSVVCDIDILYHNGERYHEADWQRPYIVRLLPQLPPL